jgi:hypothetical protein
LKDKGKAQKGAASFRKFTDSRDEDVQVSGVLKYSSAGVLRFKCITPSSTIPLFQSPLRRFELILIYLEQLDFGLQCGRGDSQLGCRPAAARDSSVAFSQ